MDNANIIFLGTGGAWGVPELNCDCLICKKMRESGEKRERTSLLLSGRTNLLIDCGPDIRSQLSRNRVKSIDGVLISHEHGDHYMGMDDLFAYRRNAPRSAWRPIPVYLTPESWEVISLRFSYLEQMDVIKIHLIEPGKWLTHEEFEIMPFKTEHGAFAKGSVGFFIRSKDWHGTSASLVYTSDFMDLREIPREIVEPDYLIIQSFWLNEPVNNRPRHMSFQRAIDFIKLFKPGKETYLVHIGDADAVPGDPANKNLKKYEPKDPLRRPSGGEPYPIPLNHEQWQHTVDQIVSDMAMPYNVTVGHDDLRVSI
jgi:phosphoribosyl 1,2-cyclic phosphate phosphodiesterase